MRHGQLRRLRAAPSGTRSATPRHSRSGGRCVGSLAPARRSSEVSLAPEWETLQPHVQGPPPPREADSRFKLKRPVIRLHPSSCDCRIASFGGAPSPNPPKVALPFVAPVGALVTCPWCCHTSHGTTWHAWCHVSFRQCCLAVDLARPDCTSRDIGNRIYRRIRLQRPGSSTAAVQHCTDVAIETAPSMSCFLGRGCGETPHCFAASPPHDANVSSILPALPDAYLPILGRPRHGSQA
jgi:hypothetical protein